MPGRSRSTTRVMCVDDEVSGLRFRQLVLQSAGFQVLTASSGEIALDLFARESVDMVLIDYGMPGMGGEEVARRLRELRPDVPLIYLTGYLDLPPEALSQVDGFVTKGADPGELIHLVRSLTADGVRS